jgi:predicted nucleotidyltransferase component of viral defense system
VRERILGEYKKLFSSETFQTLGLHFPEQRTTFDNKTQGCFTFEYISGIDKTTQTIKIDIRIEPTLLLPPQSKEICSLFIDPVFSSPFFQNHTIPVMDLSELLAEKMRAALTRKPSAIRDFFDIAYARQHGFDFEAIRSLIKKKIENLPYTIENTAMTLKTKIAPELNPVLVKKDGDAFDVDEIHRFVMGFK